MRTKQPLLAVLIAAALMLSGFLVSPVAAQSQDCGNAYTVEPGDTLSEIAQSCGVSYSELLEANPDIDNPQLIYPGQVINMPGADDDAEDTPIPVTGGSIYIVKPGDTIADIASRFDVTSLALIGANPWLEQFDRVYPGMRLTLPRGAAQVPTLSITPAVGETGTPVILAATGFQPETNILVGFGRLNGPYYQIGEATTDANGALVREFVVPDWADEARGDYVFVVQNRRNPNARALSNHFNLISGQADTPAIPITGGPTVQSYTVRSGDTLFEIAQMFNTDLDTLLDLNPSIDDATVIYPGQIIQLPVGTRPSGPYVTVSVPQVSPGEGLTVKAYNFPANAFVDIRLIQRDGSYVQPYDAQTNQRGNLSQTIRLPDSLENGEYRIIVTTTERRRISRAMSQYFTVDD